MENGVDRSDAQANSLQCDICGVKLRNQAAAQIHAERTEHQSFSESTEEIKPLTEEEKKAKLQDLREKLAIKRQAEAAKELENTKKNASIERKKTQESSEIVEELKRKEELKLIAQKKKEKEDDIKAKARVRAQLEQDKKDRADRAAREKAMRSGSILPPVATTITTSSSSRKISDHSSARLQIRFGSQKPIVRSWDKHITMMQVAQDIQEETNIDPSTMFGVIVRGDDLSKTLEELNFVPSASLQLT